MAQRLEIIGYNFKRLRKARGWTQQEAAKAGGVNQAYISKIETGEVESFGSEAEVKWSDVFGVGVSEFFKPFVPHEIEVELTKLQSEIIRLGGKRAAERIIKALPILFGEEHFESGEDHKAKKGKKKEKGDYEV